MAFSHNEVLLEGALDWIRAKVDPLGAYYDSEDCWDFYTFACGSHFSRVSSSVLASWAGSTEALGRAIFEARDTTKDSSEKIETTIKERWHVIAQLNQVSRWNSPVKLVKTRMEKHWAFQHVKDQGAYSLTPCMMAILTDWYLEAYGRMLTICERAHGGVHFPEEQGVTFSSQASDVRITGILNRDFGLDAALPGTKVERQMALGAFKHNHPLADQTEPREGASPAIDRAAAEREWLKFGLPYPMPEYFAVPPQRRLAGPKAPEKADGGYQHTGGGVGNERKAQKNEES